MGAANGAAAHTVGNVLDFKDSRGCSSWNDGLSDLESHDYEAVQQLMLSSHAAVLVVSRRNNPDSKFVAKAFGSTNAADLAKAETGPLREAMLLRSLSHANIVKYIEAWWTPEKSSSGSGAGRLSLIMEHAEDGDLHTPRRAAQRQGQPLEEALLARWMRQVLEAISYIQSRGIVHRDLKTSNVFLKDSWATALVGDFGISSVLAQSTFDKRCAGTPSYMSPEAVRSERYGKPVDIWAVGIILYELMTFQLPFTGTLVALVYKICCTEVREAPLRDSGYSDGFISLVTSTVAKEPSARPTTAQILTDQFWSGGVLNKSEEMAHAACSRNRSDLLLIKQNGNKDALVDTTTGGVQPHVLQSWSSSEPSWGGADTFMVPTPLHGDPSTGTHKFAFDFYAEDADMVTRSVEAPAFAPTAGQVAWTDPEEALRQELHAAHVSGAAMSPEHLEALLAKLGACTGDFLL